MSNNERITLQWNVAAESLPKPAVKVLLNLSLFGMEALVRGGTLEVGAELNDGASEIVVRATGPRIAFDETVGKALEGSLPEDQLSSRTAPAALIQAVAQELGGGVQYALSDGALVLGAVLPGA